MDLAASGNLGSPFLVERWVRMQLPQTIKGAEKSAENPMKFRDPPPLVARGLMRAFNAHDLDSGWQSENMLP